MSDFTINNTTENKRAWLLPLVIIVLVAAIGAATLFLSGNLFATTTGNSSGEIPAAENPAVVENPQALWESQNINSYRYTLQVGCFCIQEMVRPVTIEIIDGEVASITYVDDGTTADPQLFERYDSVDELFAIINDVELQNPVRLDVTYDETYGVPLSVNYDIDEMIADEELYLTISDFEVIQ